MSGAWRHDLIPVLSLMGVILDGLGGLYLAYDLLGVKHGPLRTITKSVSYGVMFGIIYGLPLGVWFGLAGQLASGPALSFEIGRRELRDAILLLRRWRLACCVQQASKPQDSLPKDAWFGISFGMLSAIGLVASYLMVGPPLFDFRSRRPEIDESLLARAVFRGA